MLKIRLQGTLRDIRWFKGLLERHEEVNVQEVSEPFANKGTNKYFRVYAEVKKEEKQSPEVKILSQNDELKKQAETKNKSADKADLDIENANSKNQKILKFYKEGLDNRTIAKQLGLGVGEVKLVVDLYKNSLG